MILAITGKCCSGKNYVTSILEKKDFITIDADLISRKVFNETTDKIIELFGNNIVTDGKIDRTKVADYVFSNSEKRMSLEALIHPLVYEEIFRIIDSNKDRDYIVNIPLLNNATLINRCDAVIWIKSSLLLRFVRGIKRDKLSVFTQIKRIYVQRKLSVKHLKSVVDIYIVRNSFSERVLNRDIVLLLKGLEEV